MIAFALCTLALGADHAAARSTVVRSLDRNRILASKQVGGERWLITYELRSGSVRGNVLRADGTVVFLDCEQLEASPFSLHLACYDAPTCELFPCDRDVWTHLADVELPRSFFALSDESPVGGCLDVSGVWFYNSRRQFAGNVPNLTSTITQSGCAISITFEEVVLATGFVAGDTAQVSVHVSSASPGGSCVATGALEFKNIRAAGAVTSLCDGELTGILLTKRP